MRPSEEAALELYQKYGPGSKEAIVGFTFDLGEITDPVYGTAKNLSGQFPFALAPGELVLPEPYGKPATIQKYAEELLPHCRDAFPDLLDEEIIAILKDYGILCILCPDSSDSNVVKGYMLLMAFVWLFDDLMDSENTDVAQICTYKSLQGFFAETTAKVQECSDAIYDSVPDMHSASISIKAIGKLAFSLLEQRYPNIRNAMLNSPLLTQSKLDFQALFAMKDAAIAGKQYSKTTTFELYRYVSFTRQHLEGSMVFRAIEIPPEIRSDILFQIALNNFSDIAYMYNAILGFPRDVRKKQEDSQIMYLVTVQKKSLQEAFDEIYSAITDAFNDYMINTNKLLEVYDDPNLKKYVEIMNFYLAGTLVGYKCAARYGVQEKMNVVTKKM